MISDIIDDYRLVIRILSYEIFTPANDIRGIVMYNERVFRDTDVSKIIQVVVKVLYVLSRRKECSIKESLSNGEDVGSNHCCVTVLQDFLLRIGVYWLMNLLIFASLRRRVRIFDRLLSFIIKYDEQSLTDLRMRIRCH